ncbi:MAG TPA: serine/threonine-protein kinase, partial [Polyangiaceae bacterium]|nr:serine/threonine-protein kinase [Polyangiaceae bacterium]
MPEGTTESLRPLRATSRRSTTNGSARTWSERGEATDAEERRRALPKLFGFVLVGWLLFGLLDVYIALVAAPSTSLLWMLGWRVAGAIPPLVGWLLHRKRTQVDAVSSALELITFMGVAFCLAMRALAFGGLDSHLVSGVSLLLMVQTMAVPVRWRRSLVPVLLTYAVYPAVMGLAALREPDVAAQWRSVARSGFVVDYSIVAAVAFGGVVGGHIIWAMRRQLYYARRLGRYRLKARIGHGGTSEVWLAWDDGLRRDVALKILDRSVSSDATAIARFEREAMAASGLQSPNTIRVFDFGASDDGVWFMAMEHLEGVDLATLVDEVGPLPPARAVRFTRQACGALAEAHDAGIVHRDVKPDNLFVCRMGDEDDFLKVLDFGIAKIEGAEEDATVTRAGWVHGTPAYMSPEVCNGQRADARSDVYSLGAVLYFLLTGTPPFTAPTAAAVMVAHVSEHPDLPSHRGPVPPDVEKVVMRALEKDPASRFQSAREMDLALTGCKDASGWTRAQATAFWSTFDHKPRSGVATRLVADDEA